MVTSTRFLASSVFTSTFDAAAICKPLITSTEPIRELRNSLRIHLASGEYLLRLRVERDLLAGLDRCDIHAQRDGVAVSGIDAGVRLFARTDALHPVAHVGRGLVVGTGISCCGSLLSLAKREAAEEIGFHTHLGRGLRSEAAVGVDDLFVHVERAAV